MNLRSRTLPSLALLLFCLCCFNTNTASAASPDHWVGTWATAPMAQDNHEDRVAPDTTYREIVHVSMGGPAVRVILTNAFGLSPLTIDEEMYKWRHLIENFFCKLKEFKRIAMRACKTDQSFKAMIYLAAAVINSR